MNLKQIFAYGVALVAVPVLFCSPAAALEFDLAGADYKRLINFKPAQGEMVFKGEWEGEAEAIDIALYSPRQFFAKWRTAVKEKQFSLTWTFQERDIDPDRPWKLVIRPRGGAASGEVFIKNAEVIGELGGGDGPRGAGKSAGGAAAKPEVEEVPQLPLDDFGLQVKTLFLSNAYYKPWVEKAAGKKEPGKLVLRPLGLAVTPSVRKVGGRFGQLSVSIRNITLTPALNVQLKDSISGGAETILELLARIELPGEYLLAARVAPFQAITGEAPRLTSMLAEVRSVTQGPLGEPASHPVHDAEALILVPLQALTPGDYVITLKPVTKVQAEVLFTLGVMELFRLM